MLAGNQGTARQNGTPVDGTASNMTSTFQTDPINAANWRWMAIQFAWTNGSGLTGTFTIQGSLDGSNWSDLTLSGSLTASGASGNQIADISTAVTCIRAVYTASAGTGKLKILWSGKG